jgi:hypothetical protein
MFKDDDLLFEVLIHSVKPKIMNKTFYFKNTHTIKNDNVVIKNCKFYHNGDTYLILNKDINNFELTNSVFLCKTKE